MELVLLSSNNKTYSLKSKEVKHATNMSSDTLPSPFVASASSVYSTSLTAYKAFSGENTNAISSWVSADGSPNSWVQIDYGSKKIANIVYVTNRNDFDSFANSSPKDFNILGSNDGISFDVIAEIKNQTNWIQNETRKFLISEPKEYRYYRLEIISNNGGTYTAIGEILYASEQGFAELPSLSEQNFVNYGETSISNFNVIRFGKNYILQDTVSENSDGLWVQEIDRKPLSIKFE